MAAVAPAATSASGLTLSVSTRSPQDVTAESATLRAAVLVSVLGGAVGFQYGTTTDYGLVSATVGTSLLGVSQQITVPVGDLEPATTYHLRAIAASGMTIAIGRDVSFTTAAAANSGSGSSGGSGSGSSGSGSSGSGSGSSGSGPTTSTPSPSAPGTTSTTPASTSTGDSTNSGAGGSTVLPADASALAAPILGRTVSVAAVRGAVTATTPSGSSVDLNSATALPTGTVIDTRKGTVELTTALDRQGAVQKGRFWGGVFEVRQSATAKGLTQLVLRGAVGSCRSSAATPRAVAHAAKAKKPKRALWGSDDHGRFQTRGRGSVATVRGTRWYTEDRCEGTLTRVVEGAVSVYDLRRKRATVVTHGHAYLARIAR